ncbi:MAG: hypothetical protein V3V30_06500 [Parvularculaceae bacterium]
MEEETPRSRQTVFVLLHALFWAFAMIAVGALWGDRPGGNDIVPWMAFAYIIISGFFFAGSRKRRCD